MRTMKERQPMDEVNCIRRNKAHGTEKRLKYTLQRKIKKTIKNTKARKKENQSDF